MELQKKEQVDVAAGNALQSRNTLIIPLERVQAFNEKS
jgi:hypothetical protein